MVADASDSEVDDQLKVTKEVISDLGGADKPVIYAFNKCDACPDISSVSANGDTVMISAKNGSGIDELLATVESVVKRSKSLCKLLIPYTEQYALSALYNSYTVKSVDYINDGIMVEVILDARGKGQYVKYCLENE